MYQNHSFHLETSGIPTEQWQQWQPPAGMIINFAPDSTSSKTGSLLNRKKGKKKHPHSFVMPGLKYCEKGGSAEPVLEILAL